MQSNESARKRVRLDSDSDSSQNETQPCAGETFYQKFEGLFVFEGVEVVADFAERDEQVQKDILEAWANKLQQALAFSSSSFTEKLDQALKLFVDPNEDGTCLNLNALTASCIQARSEEFQLLLNNFDLMSSVIYRDPDATDEHWRKSVEFDQVRRFQTQIKEVEKFLLSGIALGEGSLEDEQHDDPDMNKKQALLLQLLQIFGQNRYARQDDNVYTEIYVCPKCGLKCDNPDCTKYFAFSYKEKQTISQEVYEICSRQKNYALWGEFTASIEVQKYVIHMLTTLQDSQFPDLKTDGGIIAGLDGIFFQDVATAEKMLQKRIHNFELFVPYGGKDYRQLKASRVKVCARTFLESNFAVPEIESGEYFDAVDASPGLGQHLNESMDDFVPFGEDNGLLWGLNVLSALPTPHFDHILKQQGYENTAISESFPTRCTTCDCPETAAKFYKLKCTCPTGKHTFAPTSPMKMLCTQCKGTALLEADAQGVVRTCDRCSPCQRSLVVQDGNIECPACGQFHTSFTEPCAGCKESPHLWWSIGLEEDRPVDVIYALFGRMMYPLGKMDNWQVCPFVYGAAQCGKSLLLQVIEKLVGHVGTIMSTIEPLFGIGPFVDPAKRHNPYRAIVCPEVRSPFQLPLDQFQAMMSGDQITAAIKYGKPVTTYWDKHFFLVGNKIPKEWTDGQTSQPAMIRRIILLYFANQIDSEKVDQTLLSKILKTAGWLLRKVNFAYWRMSHEDDMKTLVKHNFPIASRKISPQFSIMADNLINKAMMPFASFFTQQNVVKLRWVLWGLGPAKNENSVQAQFKSWCRDSGVQDTQFSPDHYKKIICGSKWKGQILQISALMPWKGLPFLEPTDPVNGPPGQTIRGDNVSPWWRQCYKDMKERFKKDKIAFPAVWGARDTVLAAQVYTSRVKSLSDMSALNKSSRQLDFVSHCCALTYESPTYQRSVAECLAEWCENSELPEFSPDLFTCATAGMQAHLRALQNMDEDDDDDDDAESDD